MIYEYHRIESKQQKGVFMGLFDKLFGIDWIKEEAVDVGKLVITATDSDTGDVHNLTIVGDTLCSAGNIFVISARDRLRTMLGREDVYDSETGCFLNFVSGRYKVKITDESVHTKKYAKGYRKFFGMSDHRVYREIDEEEL